MTFVDAIKTWCEDLEKSGRIPGIITEACLDQEDAHVHVWIPEFTKAVGKLPLGSLPEMELFVGGGGQKVKLHMADPKFFPKLEEVIRAWIAAS